VSASLSLSNGCGLPVTPLARNTGIFLICSRIKSAYLKDKIIAKCPLHPIPISLKKGKFQIRCLCCDTDFFSSFRLSKYCSKKCKASFQAKTRLWKYETKECPNCYYKFESRRDANTKTCGARCGQAMVKDRKFGGAKLTLDQVSQIRSEHPRKTMYELAREYGVCDRTISDIVNKKRWRK
jgi:hypothetical protein